VRIFLFIVWVAFIGYAYFLAPGLRGVNDVILQDLLRFQSNEPAILIVFSLLGVFPIAFALMLLRADRYSIPAWPFVIGSFGLGAFALLPYFIFVSDRPRRKNRTPAFLFYFVIHRIVILIVMVLAIFLMTIAGLQGNWHAYIDAFWQSHLVHVMTIDFVVLTVLSMLVIYRDREFLYPSRLIPLIGLIPIVGLLIYNMAFAGRARRE
jgi:hypothetical protein